MRSYRQWREVTRSASKAATRSLILDTKRACDYPVRYGHPKTFVAVHAFDFLVSHLRSTGTGEKVNDLFLIAVGTRDGYRNVACGLGSHNVTSAPYPTPDRPLLVYFAKLGRDCFHQYVYARLDFGKQGNDFPRRAFGAFLNLLASCFPNLSD